VPNTDQPKPDEPQGAKSVDGGLAHAYEQIKSADEELARLDRLVSGMERGDGLPGQGGTGAEPGSATVNAAPAPVTTSQTKAPDPSVRRGRPMLLALVGFLLAIGVFGAAFASRYGNEAKAIMARWAPPAAMAHKEASEPPGPAKSLVAQITDKQVTDKQGTDKQVTDKAANGAADAGQQPSPPPAPSQKETKDVPPAGAATPADLAQSLKTITQNLASMNDKLDQLKSSYDQTLREQASTIQQLKTTQEQSARDNARIAEQVKALQAQLAASSAKSAAQSVKKENDAAPRQRQSVAAAPPRPRRLPGYWRPPPYMAEPWDDDPYW
jgi:hypothetical protein